MAEWLIRVGFLGLFLSFIPLIAGMIIMAWKDF